MDIVQHNNAKDLLNRCEVLLRSSEDVNNNLIQLLLLIEQESDILRPPYWFGTIEQDGEPIGCCVHAEPDGLVTTDLPESAARPLFKAVSKHIPDPHRIVGEPPFIEALAGRFASLNEAEASVSSNWDVYRLDTVNQLADRSAGLLRLGQEDDRELVENWSLAYSEERPSFLDVTDFMLGKLASKELYLWVDGEPRSMLTTSGRGMKARRVSSVFTPKKYRHVGYASTAVADISAKMLNDGSDYIILTAEMHAPAARIYERIGFVPVGRRRSYKLTHE